MTNVLSVFPADEPTLGNDVHLWLHTDTGPRLAGLFENASISVRSTSELYYDSRVPSYLDGEIQVSFVLERGMIEAEVMSTLIGRDGLRRRPQFTIETYIIQPNSNQDLASFRPQRCRLLCCRFDSFVGARPAGRTVVLTQASGIAEGIDISELSEHQLMEAFSQIPAPVEPEPEAEPEPVNELILEAPILQPVHQVALCQDVLA
jgi:hypothetical protein